jgi:lipid II:glycine glycyltransferase (peptidoglycan interpeptide bridge formation enzyme)
MKAKRLGEGMDQVVKCLPKKQKALSSNPTSDKKKKSHSQKQTKFKKTTQKI